MPSPPALQLRVRPLPAGVRVAGRRLRRFSLPSDHPAEWSGRLRFARATKCCKAITCDAVEGRFGPWGMFSGQTWGPFSRVLATGPAGVWVAL